MNRQDYKEYAKERPYKVWIKRKSGTKFLAHFKNKTEADRYSKAVGHTYTKANINTKTRRRTSTQKPRMMKMLWG